MRSSNSDVVKPSGGFLGRYSKYRALAALIAVFLILTTALALLTVYSAERFARATDELEIITRQGLISYGMTENLLGVHLSAGHSFGVQMSPVGNAPTDPHAHAMPPATAPTNTPANTPPTAANTAEYLHRGVIIIHELPKEAQVQLQQLAELTQIFDATVNALQHGGDVNFNDGAVIFTDGLTTPELRTKVDNISASWQAYRVPLQELLAQSRTGAIDMKTLEQAVEYTRTHANQMNREIADVRLGLNTVIQDQAVIVQRVQFGGVAIAFGIFLAIVFGTLRRLVGNDELLEAARRETQDIMATVNEGLFLINKDLIIAEQYSDRLEEIIQQKNIAGRSLYDVLQGMISQDDMNTLKLFVEQLYNPWVVEELIQDLNPLKQILLSYIDHEGMSATKFLEFNFLRVSGIHSDEVESVFVSVVDVTKEVRLQAQLEQDREQHNRQLEMINYLLTVNSTQLVDFLIDTKQRIERMNNILKTRDAGNLQDKAQQLYRETHSLKGNASLVNLNTVVDITKRQEDQLNRLIHKPNLNGNDFLPFTVELDELITVVSFVEDLTKRLRLDVDNPSAERIFEVDLDDTPTNAIPTPSPTEQTKEALLGYAQDIAKRQGKQVRLELDDFNMAMVDNTKIGLYKDIIMQLLKNAIVHGIESPNERLAAGKETTGTVAISLAPLDDTQHRLSVKDDGRGIDWDKIRQKAIETGQISTDAAKTLTQRDLLRLLFMPGLSTASTQDEDAGRGIGMDIVRQLSHELGGKISISSRRNESSQLSITFAP